LEFLDFSLTVWSLIIFGTQALSLIVTMAVFIKPEVRIVLSIISLWTISQIVYILYGYATKQIGFLLLGVFNIISSLFALFLKIGNYEVEEEDIYEDQ
jgi:hypothetical protein